MSAEEHLAAANAGGLVGQHRRYRKKPVVVEAVRVGTNPDQIAEVIAWARKGGADVAAVGEVDGYDEHVIAINTLEGTMAAAPGDWIIRGVEGEFYPCAASIFDQTYEPA